MIKRFKLFESHSDIDNICSKYGIKNYTINEDMSIDVPNNVSLSKYELERLPLKFRNVAGSFVCYYNQLVSLEGMPQTIGAYFGCDSNKIRTLEGFPENLKGSFYCSANPIYFLVDNWINNSNRDLMVEYFNDLDIIRDGGKTVILDRLEDFISIFNVVIDLKEVGKHYNII